MSVIPDDLLPLTEGDYQPLSYEEVNQLIVDLPKRPMLAGEREFRLSLAGAQNKLPVSYNGEAVSLPKGGAPSSHILKPPIRNFSNTVFNEAFCMRLGAELGLPVPAVHILDSEPPSYLVERYDRTRDNEGRLIRLIRKTFVRH